MKHRFSGKVRSAVGGLALVGLAALVFVPASSAQAAAKTYRLGVVTFLSGPGAAWFGIPAKNAAVLICDAINKGDLPAPYSSKGIAGMTIKPIILDEAGGATKQVSQFRDLVQLRNANAVVGFNSSGDALAIAPVAEELKELTIMFDCGTTRLFEGHSYKYVFRTRTSAVTDDVGAARYLLAIDPNVKTIAGINQNYAWGQDSWREFTRVIKILKPSVKLGPALFPKLFGGQYGSDISALLLAHPQVIYSSFWGGDLESLLLQGGARGLFKHRIVILTTGETAMFAIPKNIPEGAILGARGPFGLYAPASPLNTWFRKHYIARFKTPPNYGSYDMAQAILGLKAAADKAASAKKGTPSEMDIVNAFTGLTFEALAGKVRMTRDEGHQAVQGTAYGQFTLKNGKPGLKNIIRFPASCVNPPPGMTAEAWIKNGMKQAKCK